MEPFSEEDLREAGISRKPPSAGAGVLVALLVVFAGVIYANSDQLFPSSGKRTRVERSDRGEVDRRGSPNQPQVPSVPVPDRKQADRNAFVLMASVGRDCIDEVKRAMVHDHDEANEGDRYVANLKMVARLGQYVGMFDLVQARPAPDDKVQIEKWYDDAKTKVAQVCEYRNGYRNTRCTRYGKRIAAVVQTTRKDEAAAKMTAMCNASSDAVEVDCVMEATTPDAIANCLDQRVYRALDGP